jgi:transcriptional regulator with XRE-family HTH domain
METINGILARTLREWRTKNGKEQKAAAQELKVTRAAWNHWENGTRFPTGHQLVKLSKYTGIEICRLLCCHNGHCAECPDDDKPNHKRAKTGKQRVASSCIKSVDFSQDFGNTAANQERKTL